MATPSKKHPALEKMLDTTTQSIFGRKRTDSIKSDTCVTCGKLADKFRDELSVKEFTISGMCQTCQDSVF
jgi:hypothetical protein